MTKTTKELLQARYEEVQAEIAGIEKLSGPLREKRAALQERILPVEAEMRELQQAIKEAEQPRLGELRGELSALAKALGSKSMKAEGGQAKTEG